MHTASGIEEAQGSSKGKGKVAGGESTGDLYHCAKLQGVILGVGEFSSASHKPSRTQLTTLLHLLCHRRSDHGLAHVCQVLGRS